jgi:glutamyl-Q tRNA(Asp) synthetase
MTHYVGRFAPSPTGPLHLGSLYTAVASFLDAKAQQGKWLLRIEDLDPPREQATAREHIIQSLKAHGLHWDGEVIYQSLRHSDYDAVIQKLLNDQHAYYCECSRQQLQQYGDAYPGFCRNKLLTSNKPCAIRCIANLPTPEFVDRLLGRQVAEPLQENWVNDFVIFRKDGYYAYQLAVVVDDIAQQVSHIVRGSDILDSTFKQAYLYHYLSQPLPQYLHLPVLNAANGQKLSKQNLAPAINNAQPCANLLKVLTLLQQPTPPIEQTKTPEAILQWAIAHWNINTLSKTLAIST